MDSRQLKIFLAIAETASVTRAAERLGRSQPAVSAALKTLEDQLGTALFTRRQGRLRLTMAGRDLLPHAEAVLRAVSAAAQAVAPPGSEKRPALRLGLLPSLPAGLLPGLLQRLRRDLPGLALTCREEAPERLARLLAQGRLDAALSVIGPAEAGAVPAGARPLPLPAEPFVALVGREHGFAGRRRLALADLAGQPFVLRRHCELAAAAGRKLAAAGIAVRVVAQVRREEAALALVAGGLGLTLAPQGLASGESHGLRALPVAGLDLSRRLGIIAAPGLDGAVAALLAEAAVTLYRS